MKLLVLNYEYPPVGGGGGRACADLCRELARRGHEVRIITSRAKGLDARQKIDGYLVQRVRTGRRSYEIATFSSMAAYLAAGFFPALAQILRWKPDLVHVHFAVPTGVMAPMLSRLTGTPYVLTAHLGDVPGGVRQKTDRWFRWVYRFTPPIWQRAARVVAVSGYTRQLALKHYPVAIDVIPNGVALPDPSTRETPLTAQPIPRLIFAGRFQPQKNLPFLIDTLGRLKELPWRLTMVGDGPEREQIQARVQANQIQERVDFPGWISSEEVWQRLGESDILAMPSLSEGLPVVGVHALAQGVAIIANRAGGLVDLVEDGVNGRLCEIGDGECYEDALRWALTDQERLGKAKRASQALAQRYDIASIAERYEALFLEAAQG